MLPALLVGAAALGSALALKNTFEYPEAFAFEEALRDIAKLQEGPPTLTRIKDAALLTTLGEVVDIRTAYSVDIPGAEDIPFQLIAIAEKGGGKAFLVLREGDEQLEIYQVMSRLTISPSLSRMRLKADLDEALDRVEGDRIIAWLARARTEIPVDRDVIGLLVSQARRKAYQAGYREEINEDSDIQKLRALGVCDTYVGLLLDLEEVRDFVTDAPSPDLQGRISWEVKTLRDVALMGMLYGAHKAQAEVTG